MHSKGRRDTGRRQTASQSSTFGERGLTLVELLLALAIIGIIGAGIVMAVHQMLTASTQANDQQYAITQLRQAEHWITRDGLMAQEVSPTGFPLELRWIDSSNVSHEITYTLAATSSGAELYRNAVVGGDSSSLRLADHIDSSQSSCVFSEQTLTVTLVATRREHTETRVFEVEPRASTVTAIE